MNGTDLPETAAAQGLDPLLVDPTRLRIMALLGAAERVEFGVVIARTGLSDSALSKQAATLRDAGYLEIGKGRVAGRARTWFTLTPGGRRRLRAHIAALRAIADTTDGAGTDSAGSGEGDEPG